MIELPSATVFFAAFLSGVILGLGFRTNLENNVRSQLVTSMSRKGSVLGIALSQLIWLIVLSVVMVTAGVVILRLGSSYPMSQTDRFIFALVWILSIAFAKYLRFCYWKRRAGRL